MLSPSPPPPPLPPPLFPLESTAAGGDHRSSYNPSILIIAAIIAAAIVAAASIHLLLRVISRSRSPPFIHHLSSSSSSSSSSSASAPSSPSDQDPKAVIDSLPLFSLSSSTAKPTSSLDCAVCLSPFLPSDELRLLPSCRHAFHSQCIDTWLKSNLSCPLCRSPITPIHTAQPPASEPSRSESFRVEIGSVSRRTDDSSSSAAAVSATAPHARSYSLGSSFEYVVEEEIETVLARVRRRPAAEKHDIEQAPPPPGDEVAEIAGESHRSWLKEYVDRLATSASSSFSSLRFSQRGSHRFDSSAVISAGGALAGDESWDLERNLHLHLEEEDGGFSSFYQWFVGA